MTMTDDDLQRVSATIAWYEQHHGLGDDCNICHLIRTHLSLRSDLEAARVALTAAAALLAAENADCVRLEAEVAKLRATLTRIADASGPHEARSLAQEALEQTTGLRVDEEKKA